MSRLTDMFDPPPHPSVRFTYEGAPVAWQRAGRAGSVTYTPKKTRQFETAIGMLCRRAMGALKPASGPIAISLVAFVPIPDSWSRADKARALAGLIQPTSRPDLDNYEKAVLDGLNGVAWYDDSQVCNVVKAKRYSAKPRVVVEITPLHGFRTFDVPKKYQLRGWQPLDLPEGEYE